MVDTVVEEAGDDTAALDEQWMKARAKVPEPEAFEEDEFVHAPELETLAETLIKRYDLPAQHFPVTVLWAKRGGSAKGRPVITKCQKLSGLTKWAMQNAQFAIWVAADHAVAYELTNYQIEAALHESLVQIDASVDDDGVTTPRIKSADIEGYSENIIRYGTWKSSLKRMSSAFKQARLIPEDYVS